MIQIGAAAVFCIAYRTEVAQVPGDKRRPSIWIRRALVQDVKVQVISGVPGFTTRSDSHGQFVIPSSEIPSNGHLLIAGEWNDGFASAAFALSRDWPNSKSLELSSSLRRSLQVNVRPACKDAYLEVQSEEQGSHEKVLTAKISTKSSATITLECGKYSIILREKGGRPLGGGRCGCHCCNEE